MLKEIKEIADTGATGSTGAKGGDKGDKGDTGATGSTGAKGDKGDKGQKGEEGTITCTDVYNCLNNGSTYIINTNGGALTAGTSNLGQTIVGEHLPFLAQTRQDLLVMSILLVTSVLLVMPL